MNSMADTRPHKTHLHYAQILIRNKVVAVARNSVGSRSRGCGYGDLTIHAERAVVKKLGDTSKLKGAVLVVWRTNRAGDILPSKPCSDCHLFLEKCMRDYGLRKVIYS